MSNLAAAKRALIARLRAAGVEAGEAARECELIVEHTTGLTRDEQVLAAFSDVEQVHLDALEAILAKRERRVPLQYCLGYAYFMGLKLSVCPGVLIPRCDTETLVAVAISFLRDILSPQVVDIGVGSGAIAIAVASQRADAVITTIDISAEAIAQAQENARAHKVETRISFCHSHWKHALPQAADALLANPPYIPKSQRTTLAPEVVLYEPAEALFGQGDDGLAFYREFALCGQQHLSQSGFAAVEVGDGEAGRVKEIFSAAGWREVAAHKDVNGWERVVVAWK